MSDKSLDKFRQEYEKLHTALKKVGKGANAPRKHLLSSVVIFPCRFVCPP